MRMNVHQTHNFGQAVCASGAVATPRTLAHIMHMAPDAPKTYLREWRKFRGLTLEAAAELIDLSHSQLSRIERGASDYTKSTLEALAAVYRCTPGDLLAKDPTRREADIVDIWDHISPDKRDQARRTLESFVNNKSAG